MEFRALIAQKCLETPSISNENSHVHQKSVSIQQPVVGTAKKAFGDIKNKLQTTETPLKTPMKPLHKPHKLIDSKIKAFKNVSETPVSSKIKNNIAKTAVHLPEYDEQIIRPFRKNFIDDNNKFGNRILYGPYYNDPKDKPIVMMPEEKFEKHELFDSEIMLNNLFNELFEFNLNFVDRTATGNFKNSRLDDDILPDLMDD